MQEKDKDLFNRTQPKATRAEEDIQEGSQVCLLLLHSLPQLFPPEEDAEEAGCSFGCQLSWPCASRALPMGSHHQASQAEPRRGYH